jgi:hypothetical protein
MMRSYRTGTELLFLVLLCVTWAAWTTPADVAGSDSLPDTWSGVVRLWWDSGIPAGSPLHQQTDHISIRYTKRWSLRVVFNVSARHPNRVTYTSRWASVDYLETSATVATKGAVSSNEVWKIEADNRIHNSRQCHLTLMVDPGTKEYWIEVGGFDIDDAAETGQIVMSVAGRTVSEPIDKKRPTSASRSVSKGATSRVGR